MFSIRIVFCGNIVLKANRKKKVNENVTLAYNIQWNL